MRNLFMNVKTQLFLATSVLNANFGAKCTVNGNKHFDSKMFFVLDQGKEGKIVVKRVPSEENEADIVTKALGDPLFIQHHKTLGVF